MLGNDGRVLLTHDLKDYVVFRVDRTGDVFQCHKGLWLEWEKTKRLHGHTKLVENVTMNEARQFCRLTREG